MGYLRNALNAKGKFRKKLFLTKESRGSRETLCVKFWKKWKLASSFSRLGCEIAYLQLTRENASEEDFQQNRFGFLEKISKHKCYTKKFSKTNKILKNLFGFDHQVIENTQITFEHVQSHKWNRHSLNISLVCCMCESSMN